MKKSHVIIASILIFITVSAPLLTAKGADFTYRLYDPALDSQKSPVEVVAGSVYGQRVILNGEFSAAAYCLPTWSRTDSQCTIGVYKWEEDFETTVSGKPLYEKRLETMRDCATNTLRFDEPLPEGEYFFAIYDTVNKVGIWRYPQTKSKGFAYLDGTEDQCDLEITIYFTETPSEPVGECKSIMNVDGTKTPPEEYVIPEGDVLYTRDAKPDTWAAIDGLGRELPTNAETGDVRQNKYVGLFYWSWHNDLAGNEPFNVNDFIEEYPEAKNDYYFGKWPKSGVAYFWNEPIYGYYRTTDRWVIRKHAELLAAAGVDVIFFDNTNGTYTWRSSYRVIFDVFEQARKDGVNTPKISFLLPFAEGASNTIAQLEMLYMDIYRNEKYQDLWFYWDGKPMLMASSQRLSSSNLHKEIKKFFTFRPGQPEYANHDGATRKWGWLSIYPQDRYYAGAQSAKAGKVEQMSVGVAQNSSPSVLCTAMNGDSIYGRSYTHKDGFAHYKEEDCTLYGYNFAEQWEYALEVDPDFVFVTGWNEWTAGRQETWGGVSNAFADEFNDEYSRDIEPTKGKLKDHYYYQLVSYIRKFKGVSPLPESSEEKTININGGADQWVGVYPEYIAYKGNTFDRNALGYGSLTYTDDSGRNDITGAKMARDGDNLYILIECDSDITENEGENRMTVYLDTKQNGLDGWESFDYVVNRVSSGKNEASVEKFTGNGFETETVGKCEYSISGAYMQIKIPRALIGLGDGFTVNFKVTDGVILNGDIMNFYTSGDAAPAGRFKYSYTAAASTAEATDAKTEAVSGTENKPAESVTEPDPGKPEERSGVVIVIAVCLAVSAAAAAVIITAVKRRRSK